MKSNYFKTQLPSQYYGVQACKEQNEKKYISQVEKFKYISTLETRCATETNNIKRVFKTRYFLKNLTIP